MNTPASVRCVDKQQMMWETVAVTLPCCHAKLSPFFAGGGGSGAPVLIIKDTQVVFVRLCGHSRTFFLIGISRERACVIVSSVARPFKSMTAL